MLKKIQGEFSTMTIFIHYHNYTILVYIYIEFNCLCSITMMSSSFHVRVIQYDINFYTVPKKYERIKSHKILHKCRIIGVTIPPTYSPNMGHSCWVINTITFLGWEINFIFFFLTSHLEYHFSLKGCMYFLRDKKHNVHRFTLDLH